MSEHIQIGTVAPRVQHVADGATTKFTYAFAIFGVADLAVYLDDAKQTAGFTVSGAGASAGGDVTFDTAPSNGVMVTLAREIAIERTSDFQEGGEFRASVLNDELDYLTAALQQVADEVDRTVALSKTDATTGLVLPDPAMRAGRYLAFDGTGQIVAAAGSEDGKVVSSYMATVLDDADAATARTTLGAQAQSALLDGLVAGTTHLGGLRNCVINGSMLIWQRGIGFSGPAHNVFTADRWWVVTNDTITSLNRNNLVPDAGTQYCSLLGVASVSINKVYGWETRLEGDNVADLNGQDVTISFDFRVDGSVSLANVSVTIVFYYTPTKDDWSGGGETAVSATGLSVAVGWNRIERTVALPATSQSGYKVNDGLRVELYVQTDGSASGSMDARLTNVQLERGSDATPFERRPYWAELELCRRYYESADEHTTADRFFFRANAGTGNHYFWLPWKVIKRAAPTVNIVNAGYANGSGSSLVNPAPSGSEVVFNASAVGGYVTAGYKADAEL